MRLDGLGTSPLLASSSTHPASLSVRVPTVAGLPAASFSLSLAGSALQSSYSYHHRFCRVHFISIVQAHAGHTSADVLVRRLWRLAKGIQALSDQSLKSESFYLTASRRDIRTNCRADACAWADWNDRDDR